MSKPTVISPGGNRSWEVSVEADGDDLLLTLPEPVLEALGCSGGGTVLWSLLPDGSVALSPAAAPTGI